MKTEKLKREWYSVGPTRLDYFLHTKNLTGFQCLLSACIQIKTVDSDNSGFVPDMNEVQDLSEHNIMRGINPILFHGLALIRTALTTAYGGSS